MNINDLPQGSYTPVAPHQSAQPTSPSSQPLNINNLPPGSYTPVQPPPQNPSVSGFLQNALTSTGNLIANAASAAVNTFNPNPDQNTIVNLGRTALGGAEELANTIGGSGSTGFNDQNTAAWDNVVNFYKQRYGSPQNFLQTLYKDPAGVAADASALLGAAGGVAKIAGLSEASEAALSASDALNPLNVVTKPAEYLGKSFQGLQDTLEEYNSRLTPLQKQKFGTALEPALKFIGSDIPVGSPTTRFTAAVDLSNDFENTLQNALEDPDIAAVSREPLITAIKAIPDAYKNDTALYPTIQRQIDEIATTIKETQPAEIDAATLNEMKRSFWKSAFDKQGLTLRNEVKGTVGTVMKQFIETVADQSDVDVPLTPELQKLSLFRGQDEVPIADFNSAYGTLLNAKKILKLAVGKNEVGITGRFISGMIGGAAAGILGGGPVGEFAGVAAGEALAPRIAGTAARSALGKAATATGDVLQNASKANQAINLASRAGATSRPVPKVKLPTPKQI